MSNTLRLTSIRMKGNSTGSFTISTIKILKRDLDSSIK